MLLIYFLLNGLGSVQSYDIDTDLASRDKCHSGKAGSLYLQVSHQGSSQVFERPVFDVTYSARETSHCITRDQFIIDTVGSGEKNSARVETINPTAGGFCEVYKDSNCTEVLQLRNPGFYLAYPRYVPGKEARIL